MPWDGIGVPRPRRRADDDRRRPRVGPEESPRPAGREPPDYPGRGSSGPEVFGVASADVQRARSTPAADRACRRVRLSSPASSPIRRRAPRSGPRDRTRRRDSRMAHSVAGVDAAARLRGAASIRLEGAGRAGSSRRGRGSRRWPTPITRAPNDDHRYPREAVLAARSDDRMPRATGHVADVVARVRHRRHQAPATGRARGSHARPAYPAIRCGAHRRRRSAAADSTAAVAETAASWVPGERVAYHATVRAPPSSGELVRIAASGDMPGDRLRWRVSRSAPARHLVRRCRTAEQHRGVRRHPRAPAHLARPCSNGPGSTATSTCRGADPPGTSI